MLHLNDIIRSGKISRIFDIMCPETYRGDNIKDFEENKKQLIATPKWKIVPPALMYIGKVTVILNNINIRLSENGYQLYDMSGELDLKEKQPRGFYHHESAYIENLNDGRYYEAVLNYFPRSDLTVLLAIDRQPKPKRVTESKEEMIPVSLDLRI